MKKVLIANIFGIGDVLFTTPLIANLKKEIAGLSVDYLCNARIRDVVESVPDVDDIFVYEKDDLVRLWRESRTGCLKAIYKLFSKIRQKRYDTVFDLTLSREFGLFFMLAGISRRIGLDYKKRGLFLTDRIPLKGFERRHVIEHYLDLLDRVNVSASEREMQLVPDEGNREWADNYLKGKGFEERRLAAIIPGGGASWGAQASRKRWSAKGFARVADILDGKGVAVAVIGDASERDLCHEVVARMKQRPAFVENSLPLKRYLALLSKCDLVLCNDGGPLHMAVALGINTVSIFGPVDERVYGPYPVSNRHKVITATEVPCRPCYNRFKLSECRQDNRCLTGISVERVVDACLQTLQAA